MRPIPGRIFNMNNDLFTRCIPVVLDEDVKVVQVPSRGPVHPGHRCDGMAAPVDATVENVNTLLVGCECFC